MPLVQVKLIDNMFTPKQKQEILRSLTNAMVATESENMRPVTWVNLKEVRSGEWGIGSQAWTTTAVQALALGKQ